jgi:hypothetical protein
VTVIRLELAVDSEVYPELHAVLTAICDAASRGERLRQLAATGLVWETVRIHGASVTRIERASDPLNAEPPPVVDIAGRVGAKSAARTAGRRASGSSNQSDFVDLALNAVPAAEPTAADPLDSRVHGGSPDVPAQHIPMLFDVVNPPPRLGATAEPSPGRVHKTVVRSRLLRMKEMGLFKNG